MPATVPTTLDPFPPATRERWQPVRSGLINLFKYENQIFPFENGHLLLRGDNGSGKSRVLAMQLPFLLDGEMSPHRVEPDRDPAKRMEWNLLMDQHERRTGYTWIEFGRRDGETGEEHFLTLGCGMDARKGAGVPDRWYFVVHGRLGRDFVVTDGKTPLNARQLGDALDSSEIEATLYKRTNEYRAAVDDALFKLGSRYEPLLDLLIQLRQPQLMRDMNEEALSNALSEALPPLAESLVGEVAESFQGLESDRQKTEDHREMLESVETFRDGYRQYVAVAVRRLCEVVRNRHSQFEKATRELREVDTRLEENAERREQAATRVSETSTELGQLRAELESLHASPEMREKRNLDQIVTRAAELESEAAGMEEILTQAEKRLAAETADREKREAECAEIRESLTASHRAVREKYRRLGEPDAADFFDWETADAAEEKSAAETWIERREKSVAHLETRNGAIADASRERERARLGLESARADEAAAEEESTESQRALDTRIEAFGDAVHRWERGLEILPFPRDEDWTATLSEWIELRSNRAVPNRVKSDTQQDMVDDQSGLGRFAFTEELNAARAEVTVRIADDEAEAKTRRNGLEKERAEIATELQQLRSGRQPEPPSPYTRDAEGRSDRAGSPLWREIDFRDSVPADEHAGWEAALEASGLLDAWVAPGGSLEFQNDDFLVIARDEPELPGDISLASVLSGGENLEPLLRRIGNHRGAARCWVDQNGNWANGLHHGHFGKTEAAFIGATARETARLREIFELESNLAGLDGAIAEIDASLARLSEERAKLGDEIKRAPDFSRAEFSADIRDRANENWQRTKRATLEEEQSEKSATESWKAAVAQRDADAADFGLSAWAERLSEYSALMRDYRNASIAFWPEWQRFLDRSEELDRARDREDSAKNDRDDSTTRANEKRSAAQLARTRADTLLETVGATVEELMAKIETAKGQADRLGDESKAAEKEKRDADIEEATLKEKRNAAAEKRETSETDRDAAVTRMETFVDERLFEEIEPDFQPDRTTFSATAAVDLARRMEKELKEEFAADDDEQWGRLQGAITQSFHEFSDQLGRHGHNAVLSVIDQDSVSVIRVEYQTSARTVRELRDFIAKELADRLRFFEEREREIIENHLIGEAAAELQRHIRDGERSVLKMNEEMSEVRTSSGMQLRFVWSLADTGDERLARVRRIFLKASQTWSPAERKEIEDFLQERIQREREADDTVSWRDQLNRALDYRAWHRFGIQRKIVGGDNVWKKLTKREFGTGSGGEKGVILTIPQFAAAAAHYESAHAHAPRLILLDEVFAGIDDPGREHLMELLGTFDLDYAMTSQEMWGTFSTVTALAICHLVTRPGFNAISVTHWIWNGHEKAQLGEPA